MSHRGVDVSKIRGLIIGIDKYERSDFYADLGGSNVSNATSMLGCFTEIGTPRSNLLCLLNEQATREAILNAFDTHLIKNPEIRIGDPILIYLAGYGNGTTSPPDLQSADKEVEMILPYDINTFSKRGNYVLGISDATLAALLQKLRQQKGGNIALITDCCHTRISATRGPKGTRTRSTYDPDQTPFNELMKEQTHKFFSDESPPSSPSLPAPWREELINDIATSGSNQSPLVPSSPSDPPENSTMLPQATDNRPLPSSQYSKDPAAEALVENVEHKPSSTNQEANVLVPNSVTSQIIEHHDNIKLNIPDLSRLYGLIIGINKYKQSDVHPDLLGCVGDAKSMLRYFTDLGVPEGHFRCLYDEDATRDAILNAFVNDLINNSDIKPHDPIVIYFAGHGDRMVAPRGWQTADGKVEMILPHDVSTFDTRGHYIYGIPDLTLAFLLYKLSREKGNNITVILDSCHSGSGTRGEVRVRASHDPNALPIPTELDAPLRSSLVVDYPSEVEHNVATKQPSGTLMAPSLETHILLAACQEEELAQEIPNENGELPSSGVFTSALLQELRQCHLATTSYRSLIRKLLKARGHLSKVSLGIVPQTFQCEGRNQDRLLFSIQYSISKGKIGLISTSDNSVYRVRIGSAQGIVPGTEFGVFTGGMDPTSPPLAVLVARDVGSTISQLHSPDPNSPPSIPKDAYATIVKYNDHSNGVRIWVEEAVKQNTLWQTVLNSKSLGSLPICWANSPENHDLALISSSRGVELQGSHLTPGQLETSHVIDHDIEAEDLVQVLKAVVYFHFHLKIQNKEAPVRSQLNMTLRELNEKDTSWGSIIYEPKGYDIFGDNVSNGTVTTLYPNPDKIFGLELINNSEENLYPYVLYYDFEDYSVGCLYEPPGQSVKAPLRAGQIHQPKI
ncbi:unnamed protein product [Rhizoctonia solani]|uniref:Peptidase C14 caspase domain-containing protein n=1 Tax=Rhizoctonia solani TaxID=456999 RepID=A0A8H3DGC5_9AGAM|nr:unnamed protein product [Rhizoctonia solani]